MRTVIFLGSAALALSGCETQEAALPPQVASATMPSSDVLEGADDPHDFSQAACGGCHAVEAYTASPNPLAPPFAAIANRQGLTDETLAEWLSNAHNYPEVMDFDLSPAQAALIAEYMLSLRSEDYAPEI